MSIVSSLIISNVAQKDSRRAIVEQHTDDQAVVYLRLYLAPAGSDTAAALTAYATQLGLDITAAEIANNIFQVVTFGSLATVSLVYSTVAANLAALRAAYLSALQIQAIMIGDYLSARTDVQLQNAFGLTAGQVTTLRTNKLTPAANAATTIRAASGA